MYYAGVDTFKQVFYSLISLQLITGTFGCVTMTIKITLQNNKEGMGLQTDTLEAIDTDVLIGLDKPFQIIVWNDEVNTFEWVIETLKDVCSHSHEQAEQCALLIHSKGKYSVKHGNYDDLRPQTEAITERGISATLEVMV